MNYELIKVLCSRRGISLNMLCRAIGYSEAGFYGMLKKQTLQVVTLEKIAAELSVNPGVFFKEDQAATSIANEPEEPYKPIKKPEAVNHQNLTEIVELQRFKIKTLEAEIIALKNN